MKTVKKGPFTLPWAWLLPVAVKRLHVWVLHAVGCDESLLASATHNKSHNGWS